MAITSVGYDGQVTEVQWAKMIDSVGSSKYGVGGVNDWKVAAHPTIDKGVNVPPGVGWGRGVYDVTDSTYAVACPGLASGTRWDLIVAKRNWNGTGGATTFDVIAGTSVKQIPAYTNDPGNVDYQPLALVQWTGGQTKPTAIVDLRAWVGPGGLVAKDEMVLQYLNTLGTTITIGDTVWQSTLGLNDTVGWTRAQVFGRVPVFGVGKELVGGVPAVGSQFLIQAGTISQQSDSTGAARVTFPQKFPTGLLTVQITSGDTSIDRAWWPAPMTYGITSTNSGHLNTSYFLYHLMTMNPGGGIRTWGNQWHRINWLAIGW